MCLQLITLHTCWKLNVHFTFSWMWAREGSSQDEVTNEYSIQLTAHCRDLFLLCCLAALKKKTGVFLQCTSVLHKRTARSLKGFYVMSLEKRVMWTLIRAVNWPALISWVNTGNTYILCRNSKWRSSYACWHCTVFQCFCISWFCCVSKMTHKLSITTCALSCALNTLHWAIKVEKTVLSFPETL